MAEQASEAKSELLSFTGYAKRRGWTQPYVSQLVKEGKIPTVQVGEARKIDPEVADRAIASFRDTTKRAVAERHAANRAAKREAPEGSARRGTTDASRGAAEADAGGNGGLVVRGRPDPAPEPGTYAHARVYAQTVAARRAELELRRELGELCEVDRVRKALAELIVQARKAFERLPDRIAGRCAAETDARRVHTMMAEEIGAVCSELAESAAAVGEQIGATSQ